MTRLNKPVRRVTQHRSSHAIGQLVITLYPGGIIGIRESRRRKEFTMDAAKLYMRAVMEERRNKK